MIKWWLDFDGWNQRDIGASKEGWFGKDEARKRKMREKQSAGSIVRKTGRDLRLGQNIQEQENEWNKHFYHPQTFASVRLLATLHIAWTWEFRRNVITQPNAIKIPWRKYAYMQNKFEEVQISDSLHHLRVETRVGEIMASIPKKWSGVKLDQIQLAKAERWRETLSCKVQSGKNAEIENETREEDEDGSASVSRGEQKDNSIFYMQNEMRVTHPLWVFHRGKDRILCTFALKLTFNECKERFQVLSGNQEAYAVKMFRFRLDLRPSVHSGGIFRRKVKTNYFAKMPALNRKPK